jgi:hypothetical protein
MRRWLTTTLFLALLVAASGCAQSLPDDKADAVLKGLAVELVKMEGASTDEKMARVQLVCEKEGIKVEALARFLEKNSDADSRLAQAMKEAFASELEALKKAYAEELVRLQSEADDAADKGKSEILARKQKMENETQAKIAELQGEFDKKKKELQETIAEVRKQQ